MRALCGAIITAGALIGLGLTAIGFGTRYGQTVEVEKETNQLKVAQMEFLWKMDKPLIFILVFLTMTAVIGLGIAFVGLAYHHYHRHHELLRHAGNAERQHSAA
jgi:hypothetical protein